MDIVTVTLNPALDREIILPDFKINKLHRVFEREKMVMDPGGKGINVSMMLDSLADMPSVAMGFLGGYTGRVISEELRRRYKNITVNFIHTEGESRENISIFDEINHSITEINAPGPVIRESDLQHFMRLFQTVVSQTKVTLISGSVPFGIPLDIYATLTKIAKEKSNRTFMEARGSLLTNAVKECCPDIVRPDMRSSNRILGQDLNTLDDFIDAGLEIIKYGAEMVIISYKMVSDLVFTSEGIWLLSETAGALDESHLMGTGDAFMAAMIYHTFYINNNLLDVAKFGMAAALAKTKYIKKEIPQLDDVKSTLNYIKTERIR